MFSKFTVKAALLLVIVTFSGMLLGGTTAFAEDYYSVSIHKTDKGFTMTTMTGFEDEDSCRETALDRAKSADKSWQPASSECVSRMQMSDNHLKMFERTMLDQPYLAFSDANNFKNIVLFTDVPPVVIDAMLWKWKSELKKQGMEDVVIVMDPQRQKLMDLVDKTKAKLTGRTEKSEDVVNAAMSAAAYEPVVLPPVRPAMVKHDSLLLHNGQRVTGQILERRQDGIWFRADDGVDLLFTNAEIKQVLANEQDRDKQDS